MSLQSTIRLYEILPDGTFHPLLITDLSHYAGTCPNVGDIIVHKFGFDDEDFYFNVQRRLFINDPLHSGWIILMSRVEPTSLIRSAREEWIDETQFWIDVDRKEAEEKRRKLDQLLGKQLRRTTAKSAKAAGSRNVKQGGVKRAKPEPAPRVERAQQAEPLDHTNRDPDYWTPARKKQLKKERRARVAETSTSKERKD
jgi:hypothetical protein